MDAINRHREPLSQLHAAQKRSKTKNEKSNEHTENRDIFLSKHTCCQTNSFLMATNGAGCGANTSL